MQSICHWSGAPHRLGVGEIRRAQDGDEDLYRDDLAGEAIDDLAGAAGEVDKQPPSNTTIGWKP